MKFIFFLLKKQGFIQSNIIFFILLSLIPTLLVSQSLQITSTGNTGTSGPGWSISGNVLNVTGNASVNASVIENHLNNNGDLTIQAIAYGGFIQVNQEINFSGSTTRTLTMKSYASIEVYKDIKATGSGALNIVTSANDTYNIYSRSINTYFLNVDIQTNGGHIAVGGGWGGLGTELWNGITVPQGNSANYVRGGRGIAIINSAIETNGGDIRLYGRQNYTNTSPTAVESYGILIENTDISTASGDLTLNGSMQGKYYKGSGVRFSCDDGSLHQITTTSGNISVIGLAEDLSGTLSSWRHGIVLVTYNSNSRLWMKTISGNISFDGEIDCPNNNSTDMSGFQIQTGAISSLVYVVSTSGDISIKGRNVQEYKGQYSNGIRFTAYSASTGSAGSIFIGFDEITPYSGNILIQSNSILQRYDNSSSSSISVRTSGKLTIEPEGNSFTYLRKSSNKDLNFDNDWNFGNSCRHLTIGKSTNSYNFNLEVGRTVKDTLSVYSNNTIIRGNLISTNNNGAIRIYNYGNIRLEANNTIQTNNGQILLWAEKDNVGSGYIELRNNVTLNSCNGDTTKGLSGGGDIILAGGLDDGSNGGMAGDGIPDNFASNTSWNGIKLGENTANYTRIYSGGGDIIIRGKSTLNSGSTNASKVGIYHIGALYMDAGKGAIDIKGSSAGYYGINFVTPPSSYDENEFFMTMISDKESGTAVSIDGYSQSSYGVVFNYSVPKQILSTGGGDIVITGNCVANYYDIFFEHLDLLALSGNININGLSNKIVIESSGLRMGSKLGSLIPASDANVNISADGINLGTFNPNFENVVKTTGTFTFQPYANSFSSSQLFPIISTTDGRKISFVDITGFTLGKESNTAALNVNDTINVAGPINIYGGDITISEGLNTTSGREDGTVLLKSATNITLSENKNITTSGGNVVCWSRKNGGANNGMIVFEGNNEITTGDSVVFGGHVWLGGSSDPNNPGVLNGDGTSTWNGITVGNGYACSSSKYDIPGVFNDWSFGIGLFGTRINTFGGDFSASGLSEVLAPSSTSIQNNGVLLDRNGYINVGEGRIYINAQNGDGMGSAFRVGLDPTTPIESFKLISASNTDTAILVNALSKTSEFSGMILEDEFEVSSSGTGGIYFHFKHQDGESPYIGAGINLGWADAGLCNILSANGPIHIFTGDDELFNASPHANKLYLGSKTGSDILNSASDITIISNEVSDSNSVVAVSSSGVMRILPYSLPGSGTFVNTYGWDFTGSLSQLQIGTDREYVDQVTFSAPVNIAGALEAFSGNMDVLDTLHTTLGGGDGSVLLKSASNISVSNDIPIITDGSEALFWANSDGQDSLGGVFFKNGSSLTTNGGHIWIGGGADTIAWSGLLVGGGYATTGTPVTLAGCVACGSDHPGVLLQGANFSSDGGNIQIKASTKEELGRALLIAGPDTINAGGGKIDIQLLADSLGAAMGLGYRHVAMNPDLNGQLLIVSDNADSDAIVITADATSSNTNGLNGEGIGLTGYNTIATTSGGGITINAFGSTIHPTNPGIRLGYLTSLYGGLDIVSGAGDIQINIGSSPLQIVNASSECHLGAKAGTPVNTSSSDITLIAGDVESSGNVTFNTGGTITIKPEDGQSFNNDFNTEKLVYTGGVSGLTIGHENNDANIEFGSVTDIVGSIEVYGGNITFTKATNADTTITLLSADTISQVDSITASGLAIIGNALVNLTNTANEVNLIAGGTASEKLRSFAFSNKSTLSIGTINPSGIYAEGTILVETDSGDILILDNIITTDNSSDAIIINAGKSATVGDVKGGNIQMIGSPTVQTGATGITKLFSGSDELSNGLTGFVGGLLNTRGNVDETTGSFSPVLSSGSVYALYRKPTSEPPYKTETIISGKTIGRRDWYAAANEPGTAGSTINSFNWIVPSSVDSIDVLSFGGGGGGAGATSSTTGGAGGSGSEIRKLIDRIVAPGDTLNIVVGNGGAGGAAGNNGNDGHPSYLINRTDTLLFVNGGPGGSSDGSNGGAPLSGKGGTVIFAGQTGIDGSSTTSSPVDAASIDNSGADWTFHSLKIGAAAGGGGGRDCQSGSGSTFSQGGVFTDPAPDFLETGTNRGGGNGEGGDDAYTNFANGSLNALPYSGSGGGGGGYNASSVVAQSGGNGGSGAVILFYELADLDSSTLYSNETYIEKDFWEATVTLQLKDHNGIVVNKSAGEVEFFIANGVLDATIDSVYDHGDGTYSAQILAGSTLGILEIGARIAGVNFTQIVRIAIIQSLKLTIDSTGETGPLSGTNWTISGDTIIVANGNANIHPQVINDKLASGNVIISVPDTGSFIYINDPISWTTDNTLTLVSGGDIILNDVITATADNAGINMYYGGSDMSMPSSLQNHLFISQSNGGRIILSGANPGLRLGDELFTVVNSVPDFAAMDLTSAARIAIGNHLVMDANPISSAYFTNDFSGVLDGLGNEISNLSINNDGGGQQNLGLFAQIQGGTIRNLGLRDFEIKTNSKSNTTVYRIGLLAGNVGDADLGTDGNAYSAAAYHAHIENVWSTGRIYSSNSVENDNNNSGDHQLFFLAGGLVGSHNNGTLTMSRCFSTADVGSSGSYSANLALGGIIGDVGRNLNLDNHVITTSEKILFSLEKSYATGSVMLGEKGKYYGIGGLAGVVYTTDAKLKNNFTWGNLVSEGASSSGIVGIISTIGVTTKYNYTTQTTRGSGVSVSDNYINVTPTSPVTDDLLPVGFDSLIWSKIAGENLRLIDLEYPKNPIYVKVNDGEGRYDGITWELVDATGTAINLGSLGLLTPTGTAVYSIDESVPAGTYSVSYLKGLSLQGANAEDYILKPYAIPGNYTILGLAELGGLTVVSAGGDAEGSTWYFKNGVISPLGANAVSLLTGDLETKLNQGDVRVEASEITVDADITSTDTFNLSFIATGDITTTSNKTIQLNKGNLIYWVDYDSSGSGRIIFDDGVTLNTINGLTTDSLSGGGHIILAGGADDGANGGVANDSIPDGFATSSTKNGVISGTSVNNVFTIQSGGGDIIIRGRSTLAANSRFAVGADFYGTLLANAGIGALSITGQSMGYYGVNFVTPATNEPTGDKHLVLKSAKSSGTAISIIGESAINYGVVFNYANPKEILATAGGDINITGYAGGNYGIFMSNIDILASGGNMTLDGGERGILFTYYGDRLGSRSGTEIESSTANIRLIADRIVTSNLSAGYVNAINTSGTLTIEPYSTSFSSNLSYPISRLNSSLYGGLTLGKAGNVADISISDSISVAGPVTIYANDISLNGDVNTTEGGETGDILLKATGKIVVETAKEIDTDTGNVILWASLDGGASGGHIELKENTAIQTNGGHVWMGGSTGEDLTLHGSGDTTWNGLTVGNGYAVGTENIELSGRTPFRSGISFLNTNIQTNGGDFYAAGLDAGTAGSEGRGTGLMFFKENTIDVDSGTISLIGYAGPAGGFGILSGVHSSAFTSKLTLQTNSDVENGIYFSGITAGTARPGVLFESDHSFISNGGGGAYLRGNSGADNGISIGNDYNNGNLDYLGVAGLLTFFTGDNSIIFDSPSKLSSQINIGAKTSSPVTSSSADVLFICNAISDENSAVNIKTNGSLTLIPETTSGSIAHPGSWNFDPSLAHLTIGRDTLAFDTLILQSVTKLDNAISVAGNYIEIQDSTVSNNGLLSIHCRDVLKQTGMVGAPSIALFGTANFMLNDSTNSCDTISGGSLMEPLGRLHFISRGKLVIGNNNPFGITATQDIWVETDTGNIVLAAPITTSSSSNDAVIINAGRGVDTLDAFDGNIEIIGNPVITKGAGGIVRLYSGGEFFSPGLTDYVGGLVNVRIGSDETTMSFDPPLEQDSFYAIYREDPNIIGDLVIVEEKGDPQNLTWVYANGVIRPSSSSPALIDTADLLDKFMLGSLVLDASSISIEGDIISKHNHRLTFKAKNNISTNDNRTIQTNGGALVFWADQNADSLGSVIFGNNLTLNTTNGDTLDNASGGAAIIIAGGADDGGSRGVSGDSIPDGRAFSNVNCGVRFGTQSSSFSRIYSGGGDIVIRGESETPVVNPFISAGISQYGKLHLKSGEGEIQLYGKSLAYLGIYAGSFANNAYGEKYLMFNSTKTIDTAITITGVGEIVGISFAWDNPKEISATGGGKIVMNGITNSGSTSMYLRNIDILSSSGDIVLNGADSGKINFFNTGARIGHRAGSRIDTSFANIFISSPEIYLSPNDSGFVHAIQTFGSVVLESDDVNPATALTTLTVFARDSLIIRPKDTAWTTGFMTGVTWDFDGVMEVDTFVGTNEAAWLQILQFDSLQLLSIGKPGMNSNLTIHPDLTLNGELKLAAYDLNLQGSLTANNSRIYLDAGGRTTQASPLTANGLSLSGSGNYELTDTLNQVDTLVAGTFEKPIDSLRYYDADSLVIGALNTSGIFATGIVEVATKVGDLHLIDTVKTTYADSFSIKLVAGINSIAGEPEGGDVQVYANAKILTDSAARAFVLTGSYGGASGLLTITNSNFFDYNKDYSSDLTNYEAGKWVLFREDRLFQVWTDYDGFWTSSDQMINPIMPDSSHHLLAFSNTGSRIYSTGVNDSLLEAMSIAFIPTKWRALPVRGLPEIFNMDAYQVLLGKSGDGNPAGASLMPETPLSANPDSLEIASFLNKGSRGLDLGAGIAGIPKGTQLRFPMSKNRIHSASIEDGIPDLLLFQLSEFGMVGDTLCLVDTSGNMVGNELVLNHDTYVTFGNWSVDYYRLDASIDSIGRDRELKQLPLELAAFGLHSGNVDSVSAMVWKSAGESSLPFIAFNEESIGFATKLEFTQSFSDTLCANVLLPVFNLNILDAMGDTTPLSGALVQVALLDGEGSLIGKQAVKTDMHGAVIFDSLLLSGVGDYQLSFNFGSLQPDTSTLFVYDVFTPGSIDDSGEELCPLGTPTQIQVDSKASGGDEDITYVWYKSIDGFVSDSTVIPNSNVESYTPPAGVITRHTWYKRFVKDGTCNTAFELSDKVYKIWRDTTPPVDNCDQELEIVLMWSGNEVTASTLAMGTTDNCGEPISYSFFDDFSANSKVFDCSDIVTDDNPFTLYIKDNSDNVSTCEIELLLDPAGQNCNCNWSSLNFALGPILPNLYKAEYNIVSRGTVQNNTEVHLRAGGTIKMLPGFSALSGSLFSARIDPCTPPVGVNYADGDSILFINPDLEAIPSANADSNRNVTALNESDLELFISPNPFNHFTNIQLNMKKEGKLALFLQKVDGAGQPVLISDFDFLNTGIHRLTLDASRLSSGMYVLIAKTNSSVETQKLLKIE